MQGTAIGTVTVTILLLGIFLFVRGMLSHLGTEVFSQIEISVYLTEGDTAAGVQRLQATLKSDPRIVSAVFVPKKQGLDDLRRRMKGQIDTSILTENPLPDKFRVRVASADQVGAVAAHIGKMPGVASVHYGQDVVTKLLQLSKVLGNIGIAVIVLFIIVASIIIANTIRLTVFARRREISIMQLVGATNAYIRLPFICEGFLDGLIGALIAVLLLGIARLELFPKLAAALPFVQLNGGAVEPWRLALELLLVGSALGIVASWISVGRYLRT